MIDELNATVWCKLAPSPIHGIGVFAIRDIPKGQKIYATAGGERKWLTCKDFTGLHPEVCRLIAQRWPISFEWPAPFLSPNDDARLVSFMNSSEHPNYDHTTDCVTRDIEAGEEITETLDGVYLPHVV